MEQITLYFRQGTSDKVYQTAIQQKDSGFIVTFAYGRRGSTMNTGTKTPSPVPYEQAKAIFDKLVKEKAAKGYTLGKDGAPYQHTDKADQSTGIQCQLLNAADEVEVGRLVADPSWCMQEKHDGKRLLIRKADDGTITGINRKGLIVSIPESIAREVEKIPSACILDGEAVGEQFIAFDVLEIGTEDVRNWPYKKRLFAVGHLILACDPSRLKQVHSCSKPNDKREWFARLKEHNREGVVFKRLNSAYTAGRPASGGDQLKHKFVETASFIVSRINAKRSVSLMLFDSSKVVNTGNVTIPADQPVPEIGKVVEVRYLYAFPESRHVYQPVFLGVRDDITHEECTVDQLKFKADAVPVPLIPLTTPEEPLEEAVA